MGTKYTLNRKSEIVECEIISESTGVYSLLSDGTQMFRKKSEVFDTPEEVKKAMQPGGSLFYFLPHTPIHKL